MSLHGGAGAEEQDPINQEGELREPKVGKSPGWGGEKQSS